MQTFNFFEQWRETEEATSPNQNVVERKYMCGIYYQLRLREKDTSLLNDIKFCFYLVVLPIECNLSLNTQPENKRTKNISLNININILHTVPFSNS